MMGLVGITDGRLSFEGRQLENRADFIRVRQGAAQRNKA